MSNILRRRRSFRVFLIDEGDRPRRFPLRDYFSFARQDGGVPHFELAGGLAKFAEVEIDRASRRIVRASYMRTRFGPDGRPDPVETRDEAGLLAQAIAIGVDRETRSSALKERTKRFGWTPSPLLEALLHQLAFRRSKGSRAARVAAPGRSVAAFRHRL